MANLSLALQGGVASGTEQSFDGQPVQAGTHLRWSFLSALGFPPGGFQLFRRIDHGEIRVVPPHIPQPPVGTVAVPPVGITGAPASAAPGWGTPDPNSGWQAWGSLFTLPVTNANWPSHYFGAPLPTAPNVIAADVGEATHRLGTLKLSATDTPAQQQSNLQDLRTELNRLVNGYPATPLSNVPLPASDSGASAPSLNINVMDQLLLLALDPYFARVLGLYFVDTATVPGVKYDYCIVGYWGNNHAVADVIFPGLASGTQLANGNATWQGLHIAATPGTSLWRWIKGNLFNQLDPTAPLQSSIPLNNALAGLAPANQPNAILILANVVQNSTIGAAFRVLQGTLALGIQVSGIGTITAYTQAIGGAAITAMAPVSFNSNPFTTISIVSPGYFAPIVAFIITATQNPNNKGTFALVGAITVYATAPGSVGNIYALLTTPAAITAPPAPGLPVTTFRKRAAIIDTNALKLVPQSLFDVEWPAPTIDPTTQTGDPYTQPRALPPPTQPIGFTVQRKDNTAQPTITRLPGWVASRSVPTGTGSQITTPKLYRQNDSQLPDPAAGSTGYSHAVTAFNIFGVIGPASAFSKPIGVEKVAAAPSSLHIVQFDNSTTGGGAPLPDGSAWSGGTLNLQVAWDASAFMMYPDIQTAEAQLVSIDSSGNSTGSLGNYIFNVPAPTVSKVAVAITPYPPTVSSDGYSYTLTIRTNPALPVLGDRDPSLILMLQATDSTTLSFAIRPVDGGGGIGVATLNVSNISPLVTTPANFHNQPGYLVSGWKPAANLQIPVPLHVPVGTKTARGQVSIVGSTKTPFLPNEQLVDPNGIIASRGEPQSTALSFTGAQRLVPAAPDTPLPDVNHIYYDPADVTGQASKNLPFVTPGGAGVSGYVLKRAPIHSVALADIARRQTVNNAFDPHPTLSANGENLAAFIASLPQWLTAFNAINGTHATSGNVLSTGVGQRAFIDHFYGGLLDGELRAVGDIAANAPAFGRVNPTPIPPPSTPTPVRDTVVGTGYARNLYKMAAVNEAGSLSGDTGSVGPVYTRVVTPPRAPVLYKVQSAVGAVIVAWALDTNPDVAAYLIYRAATPDALADLRYFGSDPAHPAPSSALSSITTNTQTYPPLTFNQGTGGNIDARLVAFVPDPRLVARDYTDSVAAEIVLPPGPPPDHVNGVYRLSDYIATPGATQVGFNYWTAPVSGIPAVAQTTPTETRLIGLRIGLGRGVPVVVVATWGGVQQAVGVVTVRRAGFVDLVPSATTPADANAIPGVPPPSASAPNFYSVVSVDIFGNRSAPSKVFAGQMFATT